MMELVLLDRNHRYFVSASVRPKAQETEHCARNVDITLPQPDVV